MKINKLLHSLFFYRNRSELFRRGFRNSVFSLSEYISIPILYIVITPILVKYLGLNRYGILMLASAVTGVVGILNLGTSEATVKYVSLYRGRNDEIGIARSIKATYSINFVLSILMVIIVLSLAPFLVHNVFKISSNDINIAISALQIASIGLGLKTITGVFNAVLRGLERYDLTSKINIASISLTMIASAVLAAIGYGIIEIVISNVLINLLTLIIFFFTVRRFIKSINLKPIFNKSSIKEVLNFGFFSWLQGIAAMISSQADRLIVTSFIGTEALAIYSIALQVGQQVHGIVGTGLAFLFPMISSQNEMSNRDTLKKTYKKSFMFSIISSIVIAGFLLLTSKFLLTIWMGTDFAEKSYVVVNILVLAYFFLALNVVPYYMLLGLGEVRFIALTNILSGLLTLTGFFILIPIWGLKGAAIGNIIYSPLLIINYLKIRKKYGY